MGLLRKQMELDRFLKINGAYLKYLQHLVDDGVINTSSTLWPHVAVALEEGDADHVLNCGLPGVYELFSCAICDEEIPFDYLQAAALNGGLCLACETHLYEVGELSSKQLK